MSEKIFGSQGTPEEIKKAEGMMNNDQKGMAEARKNIHDKIMKDNRDEHYLECESGDGGVIYENSGCNIKKGTMDTSKGLVKYEVFAEFEAAYKEDDYKKLSVEERFIKYTPQIRSLEFSFRYQGMDGRLKKSYYESQSGELQAVKSGGYNEILSDDLIKDIFENKSENNYESTLEFKGKERVVYRIISGSAILAAYSEDEISEMGISGTDMYEKGRNFELWAREHIEEERSGRMWGYKITEPNKISVFPEKQGLYVDSSTGKEFWMEVRPDKDGDDIGQ